MPTTTARVRAARARRRHPATFAARTDETLWRARAVVDDVTLVIAAAEVSACSVRRAAENHAFAHAGRHRGAERGRNRAGRADHATASTSVPPEKRGVGLVFQDYALFPQMTVLDNVAFGLKACLARSACGRAAMRWGGGAHRARGGLSLHAVGRRAASRGAGPGHRPRPRVLLMDEPFSNLDRRMRDAVREDTVTLLPRDRRHLHHGLHMIPRRPCGSRPHRADAHRTHRAGGNARNALPAPG